MSDSKKDPRRYSRGILGDPDRYSRGIWGRLRFLGRLREVYDFIAWNFWLLAGLVVLCGLVLLLIYTVALYRDPIYEAMERFIEAVARFFEGPESSRDGAMVLWLRGCAPILAVLGGPGPLSGAGRAQVAFGGEFRCQGRVARLPARPGSDPRTWM